MVERDLLLLYVRTDCFQNLLDLEKGPLRESELS